MRNPIRFADASRSLAALRRSAARPALLQLTRLAVAWPAMLAPGGLTNSAPLRGHEWQTTLAPCLLWLLAGAVLRGDPERPWRLVLLKPDATRPGAGRACGGKAAAGSDREPARPKRPGA